MAYLIGLGGWAKSGKDALADILVDQHGYLKTYMSKALETALLRVDPWCDINWDNWVDGTWPRETLWERGFVSAKFMPYSQLHATVGYAESKNNNDARRYLQKLGTEVGRDMCDPEVWVRWTFRDVDEAMGQGTDVAITGIRFPNELEALACRDGLAVWINRPGVGPVNEHPSDNTLGPDDFDVIVDNDGTLDDLADLAADLAAPLKVAA